MITDTNYSCAKKAAKAAEHRVNLLALCPAQGKTNPDKTYPSPAAECLKAVKEARNGCAVRKYQTILEIAMTFGPGEKQQIRN
jgi:hypothetical protein